MKLFVGLGNPDEKHRANRHNVGFMAVDRIAERHGFGPWRKKFHGVVSEGTIGTERITLLKPETYMNDSGRAVGDAQRFLKIPLSDVYVFHDELDLAPGKVRVKIGGGVAGHNGLKSMSSHLGNDYVRVRLGIGHPGRKDQVVHYVLQNFPKADHAWLEPLLGAIASEAPFLAKAENDKFQSRIAYTMQSEDEPEAEAKQKPAPKSAKAKSAEPKPQEGALAGMLRRWLGSS